MKIVGVVIGLILAGSCCVAGLSASGVACPKSPGFRLSEEAKEQCEEKADESLDDCKNLIELLENEENPTAQQRFDLLYGLMLLVNQAETEDREKALDQRMLQLSRELHEEYPNDVQVMWYLSAVGDEDTRLSFKFRIAELAPDCNHNNYWLSVVLNRLTGHGWNRAEQDEELVQEFVSVLDQGYEHGETRWDKMHFGHLRYREYLLAGDQELAQQFWHRVVSELDPGNFPYQDNSLSNGWDLLCGNMGFEFRFVEICLDTIERTLVEALESETRNVDYAMRGASELAKELLVPEYIGPFVLFPGPPHVHEISFRPYTAEEGARILIRLRGLLESVPMDSRTDSFNKTYMKVLGQETRPEEFEDEEYLELEPSGTLLDIWIRQHR